LDVHLHLARHRSCGPGCGSRLLCLAFGGRVRALCRIKKLRPQAQQIARLVQVEVTIAVGIEASDDFRRLLDGVQAEDHLKLGSVDLAVASSSVPEALRLPQLLLHAPGTRRSGAVGVGCLHLRPSREVLLGQLPISVLVQPLWQRHFALLATLVSCR
jgi:hypothetical protein